ncbi:hypothetical protein [Actinomycetospora callitridis]|jgi:hypothetical protein|uniref:hypothetical protein n=1 Tax=Actinomycetospora callitridis TaxID=913944 RepID=UPI002366C0C9|nr:hypothetical protein [Actinomycetospora callitridis]MDD7918965.1 hypothetical protein [Actinomycetospora callitridis]
MTSSGTSRGRTLAAAALAGAGAGLAGVAAMTALEKIEQAALGRPSSYVPARTLRALTGGAPSDAERPPAWNHAMHWGTGALLGTLHGVWAATGLRGPRAHLAHTAVRLATDQTLENATGVGAPPHTWPWREQAVDVAHKAVYSLVTGVVVERLVAPDLESHRGRVSH